MKRLYDPSWCRISTLFLIKVVVIWIRLFSLPTGNAQHNHPFQPIGYPCRALEMTFTREMDHVENCVDEHIDCSIWSGSNYRSIDARCNNVLNPRWGSTGSRFSRMAPKNEVQEPDLDMKFRRMRNNNPLPNARDVSNTIHGAKQEKEDDRQFSLLVMQFGQFLDHDLTLTPQIPSCTSGCGELESESDHICCDQFLEYHANPNLFPNYTRSSECWPIPVAKEDPYFRKGGPECLEFRRSVKTSCDVALRTVENDHTEFNEVTHLIDLSGVYGSLPNQSLQLRGFKNGLLKFNQFKNDMLPFELNTCEFQGEDGDDILTNTLRHPLQFQGGDVRANENPGLQVMHTLWLTEHNRIAKDMYNKFPEKSDEELFQEARKYAIAEWQHIIFTEWLPLIIGEKKMFEYLLFNTESSHYNQNEQPTIVQEFSTAAFRFGHGLIRSTVELHDLPDLPENIAQFSPNVEPIEKETLDLSEQFFRTDIVQLKKSKELVLGMSTQGAKDFGPQVADAVRLRLFKPENSLFGSDLVSLNIQRGRDHAIASYDDVRQVCNMTALPETWVDELRPPELPKFHWDQYKRLYSSPKDVELFTAGMSETHVDGGIVGPTFACIIGRQFQMLKHNDRYFYTHEFSSNSIFKTHPFSENDLSMIRRRTLHDVICDNMKDVMPMAVKNPYFMHSDKNPLVPCSSDSNMKARDLSLFNGATPLGLLPKSPIGGPEVLLLAGGFDGDSLLDSVELYSPGGTCNFDISPLPHPLYGLFCFVFEDEIYCCGGDISPSTTCYHYNRETNGIGEWEIDDIKTLNRPRFFSSVAKVEETGVMIVSGGHGKESSKQVEYLDRYSGRWKVGPDDAKETKNKLARIRACMVIVDELNMIDVGGWDQGKTIGMFNEVTGKWTFRNNTMQHNDRHSCILIPDRDKEDPEILIVGNRQKPTIFNVKSNTERETIGSLSIDRGFGALVNMNGNIYLVGGENHPTVVERFDPEHEIFPLLGSTTSELTIGRSRFGYTTVPARLFEHLGCTHIPANYDNGGYSQWGTYSSCSAVCEGVSGKRVRRRFCNNPLPSRNGKSCLEQKLGSSREEIDCIGSIPFQSTNEKQDCYLAP